MDDDINLAGARSKQASKQATVQAHSPPSVAAELPSSSLNTLIFGNALAAVHLSTCCSSRALRGSPKSQKVDEPSLSLSLVARRTNTTTTTTSLSRAIPQNIHYHHQSLHLHHTSIHQNVPQTIRSEPPGCGQAVFCSSRQTPALRLRFSAVHSRRVAKDIRHEDVL